MRVTRHMLRGFAALSVGLICSTQMASAAFVLVDNFDSYTAGTPIDGQGPWLSPNAPNNTVEVDPENASNRVLSTATIDLDDTNNDAEVFAAVSLPEGNTGTFFGRYYATSTDTNVAFGLSFEDPNTLPAPGGPIGFVSLNTVNFVFDGVLATFDDDSNSVNTLANGGNEADNVGAWYNFWMVIDNGADTVQTYIQSDDDPDFASQVLLSSSGTGGFRVPTTDDLVSLVFRADVTSGANGANQTVLFDDIWFDAAGANLVNPIPEPGTLALGLIFGLAGVVARRHQRQA